MSHSKQPQNVSLTIKIFILMTMVLLIHCDLADLGWVPLQALLHMSLIHIGPVATEGIVSSGR